MMQFSPTIKHVLTFYSDVPDKPNGQCLECGKAIGLISRVIAGQRYFCWPCCKQRAQILIEAISKYSSQLVTFLNDGQLSSSEIAVLGQIQQQYRLSDPAVQYAATSAFHVLSQQVSADRQVTPDEMQQINELLLKYNLPQQEIIPTLQQLCHLYFLTALEEGVLIKVPVDIMLKKNEVGHYQVSCELFEEKTKRSYVGGSTGFSFRIAKGVTWRIGGFKGWPVEKQVVEKIDRGLLVVTNKRLVFSGQRKSFSMPFAKLIDTEIYKDAVSINREGKQKKEYFLLSSPEVLIRVITLAVNQVE